MNVGKENSHLPQQCHYHSELTETWLRNTASDGLIHIDWRNRLIFHRWPASRENAMGKVEQMRSDLNDKPLDYCQIRDPLCLIFDVRCRAEITDHDTKLDNRKLNARAGKTFIGLMEKYDCHMALLI
jgi:hypothetical protein